MPDASDMELLRDYCRNNSETAFAELVQRHVNLVYSIALRHVGIAVHADEITQAVFVILARKAARLRPDTILESWLYETTRLTALSFLRGERRRQFREQEAYMQSTLQESTDDLLWNQLAPLLDEATAHLGKKDRDAVILRFFKDKSVREVAATMQVSEAAVQRRTLRALEKLRKFFGKRGVSSTTAILAGSISTNSVQAAPVALAKSVTTVAIVKGSMAAASTIILVNKTMKMMTWMKTKFAFGIGLAIILATGTTTLVAQRQIPTTAVIPYKMVDDFSRLLASVDQAKLVVYGTVSSKIGIASTNIHLTIQSAVKGPIPVQLGTNGQVLNFPNDETLRRENPLVLSDQPKGTLNFTLTSELPVPDSLTFSYNRLTDGIAEANKAIARANQMIKSDKLPPFVAGNPKGVIFRFSEASAGIATVEIISATGKQEYVANDDGQIKLKVEENRLTENLTVKVSEKPQKIMLDWE